MLMWTKIFKEDKGPVQVASRVHARPGEGLHPRECDVDSLTQASMTASTARTHYLWVTCRQLCRCFKAPHPTHILSSSLLPIYNLSIVLSYFTISNPMYALYLCYQSRP